jgi:hypothetical protein
MIINQEKATQLYHTLPWKEISPNEEELQTKGRISGCAPGMEGSLARKVLKRKYLYKMERIEGSALPPITVKILTKVISHQTLERKTGYKKVKP